MNLALPTGLRRVPLRLVVTAALAAGAISAPAATTLAATPACKATVVATGKTFASLKNAVTAAPTGGTIQLRGTCPGTIELARNVTIVGVKTKANGAPIITGLHDRRVVHVQATATVTLRSLTIRDGLLPDISDYPDNSGAGILLDGSLTLDSVVVRDNVALYEGAGGGGLELNDDVAAPSLVVTGSSVLRDNQGGYGGAFESYGSVTLRGTTRIFGNQSDLGGGAIYNAGHLRIKEQVRIHHNLSAIDGGAIYSTGSLLLKGSTRIDSNTAVGDGGGVFVAAGTMSMASTARIKGNTADAHGGVANPPSGTGVKCGVNVVNNTPTNC